MRWRSGFGERGVLVSNAITAFLRLLASRGPQSEQMADRVDKVGAVHRVEMEIGDAAVEKIEHLLGGHGRGDQLARGRIVVQSGEALGEPCRHRGAGACGEILRRLKFCTGRMPGTIGMSMPRARTLSR